MNTQLDLVIDGEKDNIAIPLTVTPAEIQAYMESIGYEMDMEINGWQHDFWIYYTKDGDKFCHYGCWFYGENTFSREESDNS